MPRNYKKEYENYHSSEEQKKDRAGRNGARRMLKKKYGKLRLFHLQVSFKYHQKKQDLNLVL